MWQFSIKGTSKAIAKEIIEKLIDGAQKVDKQVVFENKLARGAFSVTWNVPHSKWSIRSSVNRKLSKTEKKRVSFCGVSVGLKVDGIAKERKIASSNKDGEEESAPSLEKKTEKTENLENK